MKKKFGIYELEPRVMLDAAAVAAIPNDVFHFDAQDVDADGDTSNQPVDETAVSRWDEAENNHDATSSGGNRPVFDADAFDGRGGIRFDGSNDSFGVGNSGDINTSSYNEKSYAFVFETGSDLSGHQVLYEQGGGTRGYQLSIADGDLYAYVWNNAEWNTADHNKSINLGTLSANTTYQTIMIQDSTGPNTWSANLNGEAFQTLNNVETQRPHSGNIEIGSSGNSLHPVTFSGVSGDHFQGSVGEIFSWNHALTSQETTDVADFLGSKWFNDPPSVTTNTTLDVVTNESLSITNSVLEATDPDNTADELIYTLQSDVANGEIFLGGTALNTGDTFTQQDIDNGLLTYDHNGNATTSDSFDFQLSDGFDTIATQAFNFNITSGSATDPIITTNTGLTLDEGNNATITNSMLDSSDPQNDTWYDLNWRHRQQITIDAGNIDSDLTDFTMLLTEDNFGTDFWNNVQNDGGDIVITGGDGITKLSRELVNINTTAETMELHTKVPSVSSTTDTNLYIYYGNVLANETNDAASALSNYSHVYHMDNLNAVDVIAANDGVNTSGGSITTGIMGGAHLYNGAGLVDINDISGTDIRTISFWYNPAGRGGGDYGSVLGSNGYGDGIRHVGTDELNVRSGGSIIASTSNTFNANKHLVFSHDSAAGTLDIYENGVLQDTAAFGGWHDVSYLISIAGDINRAPEGMVDEIRISNNTLDINWASAEYANQSNPGSFYSVGTQEEIIGPLEYEVTNNVSNGTLFLDTNDNNTVDSGEELSVNDRFTQDDVDNGLLIYVHNDSENFTDSFDFTLTDGNTTTGAKTFAISVNPVSDQDPDNLALSSTSVDENSGNGSLVGILSATDGDIPEETLSFSIANDPDGKFQTNGDRLEVGGSLNHEASAAHNVTIRVSDGNGGIRDEIFTINVNDVNENPTSLTLNNNTVNENSALGALIGTFSATDPDEPGDSFSFSIVNDPDNKFQINGNRLEAGGALDFENQNTHNVTVRVSDGNGGSRDQNFVINLNDINDAPVIATGNATTAQGAVLTLTQSMLSASDQDNANTGLVFEITDPADNGTLKLGATTLNMGDAFTQQDLIDGNVTYEHDNSSTLSSDNFNFTVTDGALTTAPGTLVIDISPLKTKLNDVTLDEGSSVAITSNDLAFEGEWFNDNWQYRKQITIDSSQIDADLTDFSVLLTENGFGSDFWNNVNANGSDIVITAGDGTTKLDRELVSIDTINQNMQLYARTDLSASQDTNLFIYYGNTSASETNQASAWRSEFTGVWHFDSDFDAPDPQVNDSSQSGSEGFARNGFDSTNQVTGVTGQAADFNSSEYIALDKAFSGNGSLEQISVSGWINTTFSSGGFNDNWAIIDFDRSEFFNVFVQGNGEVGFSTNAGGINDFSSGVTVNDGNWHHISAVYDGTDKIIYVDGAEAARDTNAHGGAAMGSGTRYGFIGDGSEAGSFDGGRNNIFYDGKIDNLRMFEGTTSAEWIAAEYRNQNNPGSFYATGAQTQLNEHIQYNLASAPVNGTLFVDANGNDVLDSGEDLATSDVFTKADIDNGNLIYLHDDSETISDSIAFTVTDITMDKTTALQTMNFTVSPVNDLVSTNNDTSTEVTNNEDSGDSDVDSLFDENDEITDEQSSQGFIETSVNQNQNGFRDSFYGQSGLEEIHYNMVVQFSSDLDLSGQQSVLLMSAEEARFIDADQNIISGDQGNVFEQEQGDAFAQQSDDQNPDKGIKGSELRKANEFYEFLNKRLNETDQFGQPDKGIKSILETQIQGRALLDQQFSEVQAYKKSGIREIQDYLQ